MNMFPRIRSFDFSFSSTVRLDAVYVGRLDKFAEDTFGDVRYYKPIAAANGIKYPFFNRRGIRTLEQAMQKDIDDLNINSTVEAEKDLFEPSAVDWNHYGDLSSGAYTDVYEGRLINIPTQQSADEWLNKYGSL